MAPCPPNPRFAGSYAGARRLVDFFLVGSARQVRLALAQRANRALPGHFKPWPYGAAIDMHVSRNIWATFQRKSQLGTLMGLAAASLLLNPGCGSSSKHAATNSNPDAGIGGQSNSNGGGSTGGITSNQNTSLDAGQLSDAGTCLESGGNPCSNLPRFTGTQTVDGEGSEFCNVAPMRLDAENAAKVITYNAEPPEQLTARIAISASALHAYIEVTDPSVQTVNMADPSQAINQAYQGDAVELMFSSNNQVSGLTSKDANTLHVIVPANGPAVSTKASNSNGSSQGSATELPKAQYAQRQTSTGYAIELQLPWPSGVAPGAGDSIRFDLALDSADSTFGSVSDMRDGQLIYHLESVSNSTCQGQDAPVPFCDDRTWCTTTVE